LINTKQIAGLHAYTKRDKKAGVLLHVTNSNKKKYFIYLKVNIEIQRDPNSEVLSWLLTFFYLIIYQYLTYKNIPEKIRG